MRRTLATTGAAVMLALAAAAPAAADPAYPPTLPPEVEATVTPTVQPSSEAPTQVASGLPRTGSEIAVAAGVGLALVGGGALAIRASRRRHAA